MRLLLDTHSLAWWSDASENISPAARSALGDAANTVFYSPVSAYEIALKHRMGKWPQGGNLLASLDRLVTAQGFRPLLLDVEHARVAGALPLGHKDPFDRLLAGQALVEDLTLVSIDDKLDQFGVRRLW